MLEQLHLSNITLVTVCLLSHIEHHIITQYPVIRIELQIAINIDGIIQSSGLYGYTEAYQCSEKRT